MWWRALTPPPDLSISAWADAHRRLSPEASAEPGRWNTARAEYQRGIMDAASDAQTHTVVVMSSAQVGKTEIVNNIVGFFVDQDPSPILVLQPTLEMAQTWSKDRLAPMLRDTPALKGRVKDARTRDSGNTLLHKSFAGGHITIAGANSPASLASRPIRVLLADEVDRYPVTAGAEGDPVTLATKRTTTFWNRKRVMVSTPTVKGASRIEAAYHESDQRRFHVPCPDCGHAQVLKWANVRWRRDQDLLGKTLKHYPESAEYACEECGSLWSDGARWRAISKGEWRAALPFRGIAGFHMNELISPWVKLSDTVESFIDASGSPERLRVFVNTALGETWEDKGERVASGRLEDLVEVYGPDSLPEDVLFATAGVDTQDDRLEVEIVAWGPGERSWGVRYVVLHGDPAQETVWSELDALLLDEMSTEGGRTIRVAAAAVDSGGHHAAAVHGFCRSRFRRRVYAIKGVGGQGKPVWPPRMSKARNRDRVFLVGVDTAKDAVYARWKIEEGDGACRLPASEDLGYDAEWMRQATAEQRETRFRHGRPYTVWTVMKGRRNEATDCRVYAMAAMKSIPLAMRKAGPGAAERVEAALTPEDSPGDQRRSPTPKPAAEPAGALPTPGPVHSGFSPPPSWL